jgi:hypothetical protein
MQALETQQITETTRRKTERLIITMRWLSNVYTLHVSWEFITRMQKFGVVGNNAYICRCERDRGRRSPIFFYKRCPVGAGEQL